MFGNTVVTRDIVKNHVWLLITLVVLAARVGSAAAFDPAAYQGLSDSTSNGSIAPGTKITAENWQQYKQFLPIGLQWLYSGKYPWKFPSAADYAIEIAPTISIPTPHQFAVDTEKYSSQVKLKPMGNGGFDIEGYVAGLPFPHPSGPNAGIEILYNFYYHYQPHVLKNYYVSATVDRYMNESSTEVIEVFHRLMHVSDVNMPINNPQAAGYFQSVLDEVTSPEQSKYTTALTLFPDDVKKVQEYYVFLPSLRRSLRLSSAARCSPILGSDYLNDDNRDGFNGIPTQFKVELLGEKKVIGLVHEDLVARQDRANFTRGGLPAWAKPLMGKWELRDVNVIDIRPLGDTAATYCYGSRVLYMDKEASTPLVVDLYDNSLKPWKVTVNRFGPIPINDGLGGTAISPGDSNPTIYDIQNVHAGLAFQKQIALTNTAVPAQFLDVQRYATPGGLSQVMR
jgi:hypothetical protein